LDDVYRVLLWAVYSSCDLFEGYGQTECAAAASLTMREDVTNIGHVGVPLACNEIKLVSVEDMGYRYDDTFHGRQLNADGSVAVKGEECNGRGEVCFRGPNVFAGYYKSPDKTAEALDADGWLHSGDIGMWTPQGYLRIVDRKKNIFKLSQGEYVAAEKIENVRAPLCVCEYVVNALSPLVFRGHWFRGAGVRRQPACSAGVRLRRQLASGACGYRGAR
jgi:long-chain acyl-CoA synthetase